MTSEFRQTVIYFATVASGQGLAFLLLPLITRYLATEAYGEYALMLAVSGFVGMLGSAWIRNVGLRLYFDAVDRGATRAFVVTTTALQAALFAVLYALAVVGMMVLGFEIAPLRVVISAGVTVLVGDQFAYAVTLLRAERRTVPFAVAEIGSGVVRFVATTAALLLGLRTAELLFDATTLGYLLGSAYAAPTLWRRLTGDGRLIDASVLREVVRIGPASLPFTLSSWLERLADRLVLQHFLGTAVVGVYSVGYALGERLMGSLVQAVFMMAWPNVLNAWQQGGAAAAREAIGHAQRLYSWITVGPAVFLIAYGGPLTRWVAGPEYHDAEAVVPIVAAAMWLGGFGSYLNRHLELRKQFGRLSGISLMGAALNVGLNIVLVPRYGMVGAASATLANYAFNAAVFYLTRDRELATVRLGPLGAALGTSFVLWLGLWWLTLGDALTMIVFAVLYAAVAVLRLLQRRA